MKIYNYITPRNYGKTQTIKMMSIKENPKDILIITNKIVHYISLYPEKYHDLIDKKR